MAIRNLNRIERHSLDDKDNFKICCWSWETVFLNIILLLLTFGIMLTGYEPSKNSIIEEATLLTLKSAMIIFALKFYAFAFYLLSTWKTRQLLEELDDGLGDDTQPVNYCVIITLLVFTALLGIYCLHDANVISLKSAFTNFIKLITESCAENYLTGAFFFIILLPFPLGVCATIKVPTTAFIMAEDPDPMANTPDPIADTPDIMADTPVPIADTPDPMADTPDQMADTPDQLNGHRSKYQKIAQVVMMGLDLICGVILAFPNLEFSVKINSTLEQICNAVSSYLPGDRNVIRFGIPIIAFIYLVCLKKF
ncbi:unnamed protein product [Caenorhabditis bovis]|uniref:Uncharacterized protein n=1 Tax=Caenorhabditis bovis TaxID=2654633 RepID=A0A8S1EJS9_9PELO|nr:unnamed protein product [Caenorhabditis bovis]